MNSSATINQVDEDFVHGQIKDSLADLILARCSDSFDRPACLDVLGNTRPVSWGQLFAQALRITDSCLESGMKRGDRLVHLGAHSIDWVAVDLACHLAGYVHISLHAEAKPKEWIDQCEWLLPKGIIVSSDIAVPALPKVDVRVRLPEKYSDTGMERAVVQSKIEMHARQCDPDAPAVIFLSSGTTGLSKGIIHSQRALAANAQASSEVFLDDSSDVRLSWLPMSHALARVGDLYTSLVRGSCLSIVKNRKQFLDACQASSPTVILGVPALFERLEREHVCGKIPDLLAALGGCIRVCVSGGAPLRKRTAECFLRSGIPLVEGYGLAEAGPVVALSNPRMNRPGAVGRPLSGVAVRLDTRSDSSGQLLVQTRSQALAVVDSTPTGPRETVLPKNTWIETGDFAAIADDGQIRITGRLSEVIALSTGIKVSPSRTEAVILEDQSVAQICVLGKGCSSLIAIVVPEPAVLRSAIKRMGVRVLSQGAALRHPKVLSWLSRQLARAQSHLPRPSQVRRAVLVGRPFEVAREELTPSMKLKRSMIGKNFRGLVEKMRKSLEVHESVVSKWFRGVVCIPSRPHQKEEKYDFPERSSWLSSVVWQPGKDDGFAHAASCSASGAREAIKEVIHRSEKVILELSQEGTLYDPLPHADNRRPPITDAPPHSTGVFSRSAEIALGQVGLWGLAVPKEFGGIGCSTQELSTAITRIASLAPTPAGMLAVHSSIGAISTICEFGTPDQQKRFLPGLAKGKPLSVFGGTEPDAGSDLTSAVARLERHDGRLVLTGTKIFITGATYGRLVKILAKQEGKLCVVLVMLPQCDTDSFKLAGYPLHPLKHAHNNALLFNNFPIQEKDILKPPGDSANAMKMIWHSLNRGRVTLAAQAAGTLRILIKHAKNHAHCRTTWGAPIGTRELVQGRLGRMAASVLACESLSAWGAAAIDLGYTGEFEAIIAKILASECVRSGAIDALGVHGARAFLVGHPLGDSFHDHFAVTIYEGESELLGLALFKGIVKHHPMLERDAARPALSWLAWQVERISGKGKRADKAILDKTMRIHAHNARCRLRSVSSRIDRAIRRYRNGLAERQLLAAELSTVVRELVSVLAVAHRADMLGDHQTLLAADCWCRLAFSRAVGHRLSASDLQQTALLGQSVLKS
ncbi:MAG: AMP-binding protein [Pirellulales bacterium]